MMTGVVVVTHGDAGEAMLAAAQEKVGSLPTVRAVGVHAYDAPVDVLSRVEQAAESLGADEVLFLVDLGGSTPFNICCRSCMGRSVVLAGVNLAMLFKLSTADRTHGARQLAEELAATGTKSIWVRP